MQEPRVCIIILNYNKAEDTIACITSFKHVDYDNHDIIVIDNASTDNSAEIIKKTHPDITLIASEHNYGYAGGNNIGIKYALENGATIVLIVNNDTVMLNRTFVKQAINYMIMHKKVGIVGPMVMNPGDKIQKTILYVPTIKNCIVNYLSLKINSEAALRLYNSIRHVEAVSGVCFFLKKQVAEEIGLLDEDYFMYAEELDYCYRARKFGWEIAYLPVKSILHNIEANNDDKYNKKYSQVVKNILLFNYRYFGVANAIVYAALVLLNNIAILCFNVLSASQKVKNRKTLIVNLLNIFKEIFRDKARSSLKIN